MLNIGLSLENPFKKNSVATAQDWLCYDRTIMPHKSLEIQISRWSSMHRLLDIDIDTRIRGHDHAGPRLYIDILGFFISIQIYDHRHWDYDNDRWELA